VNVSLLLLLACGRDRATTTPADTAPVEDPVFPELDVEGFSGGCYSIHAPDGWLTADGDAWRLDASQSAASRFTLQASDLGTYLLYDQEGTYVVEANSALLRQDTLESDVTRIEDDYISGAEWILEPSTVLPEHYQLRSRRGGGLLGDGQTTDDGVPVLLEETTDCLAYPELTLDASGSITQTTFPDGDLYGIVDTHSHILSNFGFGGGIFHGGAFHRLGVEHALPDCTAYHGEEGRKDFFGYAFDNSGNNTSSLDSVVFDIVVGELSDENHITDGYPDFTDWPDARRRATHQQQYHRWLERAWLSGLRLVVQHATSNSVICNLTVGEGLQPSRYDCEDMTAVDRIVDETWQMERYIDAQSGGSGLGWFRVVQTPAEAREVIEAGKMAVILGIETSDLFDCHLTQRPGGPDCTEAYVLDQLDAYYDRGVRAVFPVHKYDNRFSPGDGSGDFIELGNFLNSGHWTNKTTDCPDNGLPTGFDHGEVTFGALNHPREEYISEPPNDFSAFPETPLDIAFPFAAKILSDPIEGEHCQNGTLTDLGETLLMGMMERGMIIEVDHLPQWSYARALELLEDNDYPAAGTHGRDANGRIYALGGVSKINLGRCQDSDNPGSTLGELLSEVALITAMGGYPAVGLGLDLNGFAGAPGPRFGDEGCSSPQDNPITYPFTAYAGDITFTRPLLGSRTVDFDTEGLIHIGMLPELLQDARSDALSDDDLEPLFRSAEGYIRMWEKAEERAAALRGGG
jgi:microsomal dipeptidase-like Zn-dependent dipeptidase